jgi:hypothetical protein
VPKLFFYEKKTLFYLIQFAFYQEQSNVLNNTTYGLLAPLLHKAMNICIKFVKEDTIKAFKIVSR